MADYSEKQAEKTDTSETMVKYNPIEPERGVFARSGVLRFLILFLVILYFVISYFYVPFLTDLGRFLVVDHEPEKSDLIICLAGGNIERGLGTADLFRKGLAPRVFIAREQLPDGYELLMEEGIEYPETIDLMIMLLKNCGVPETAILTSEERAGSTIHEATIIRGLVMGEKYRSIILLTSPYHTRRAWLTFRKVFKDTGVRIFMTASKYSGFKPDTWWKERKYVRKVIIEYQKLLFYTVSYLI